MKYILFAGLLFVSQFFWAQQDSIPSVQQPDSVNLAVKDTVKGKPAQTSKPTRTRTAKTDLGSIGKGEKKKRPFGISPYGDFTIAAYKIISHERDTVAVDTTLTIDKEYRHNYLRKDDFEQLPFANMGQPYNRLGADFTIDRAIPEMGAHAKHANYFEIGDVPYYNVPTPLTELFFKTTFEQGQLVDASLAANTSERTNLSLAYKGFRSLGKYRWSQAESGNFRATANSSSKNGRYDFQAHIAMQTIEGEENGGLSQKEAQFESGDPDFDDRRRLNVMFNNAKNKLQGKRYYFQHGFDIMQRKIDSLHKVPALEVHHTFNYETKIYDYTQPGVDNLPTMQEYFGPRLKDDIADWARLKVMQNELGLTFTNPILGKIGVFASYNWYNYYFNSIRIGPDGEVPNRLEGEDILAGASFEKKIGDFFVNGKGSIGVSGNMTGHTAQASVGYDLPKIGRLTFKLHSASQMPDFNTLLYHSDYSNFIWYNANTFKKEEVNRFGLQFNSKKFGHLEAQYAILDNHTYFVPTDVPDEIPENSTEIAYIKPMQVSGTINYTKLKYRKDFTWRGWTLANTFMYNQVDQDQEVLNLPQYVTRNSLFYSSHVFKKAMYLQTGVTFKYFGEYYMDVYNPLMAEFYVQTQEKIGNYPLLDFLINAKVRQTRIFLKAEHFNTLFTTQPKYYAAPNYPYRDFVIRFGIVWNLFS